MNKGTITAVEPNGNYTDGNNKVWHKFKYTIGEDTFSARHTTPENAFKVGDEVQYKITGSNTYGNYGSIKKLDTGYSGGGKPKGYSKDEDAILYQVCLKGVMDFYTKNGSVTNFTPENLNIQALAIAQIAKANITKIKGNG
jgi:hypothetical protein